MGGSSRAAAAAAAAAAGATLPDMKRRRECSIAAQRDADCEGDLAMDTQNNDNNNDNNGSSSSTTTPKWQETTEASFGGIVAIRFAQPIAFDTEGVATSTASGFIVDAQRGIILTNRHVVGAGPFVGEAIMHDHEVVAVEALYRDPIHDFGFLRFDPAKVKYMKLVEIPLAPERARVGIDVRIIGNDAGEKLSILVGSISRVDRNTPDYGYMTYNDLNTFYIQSAASLKGGSSGSPVIDIDGWAVGLQAGGRTDEATNFFLPLDRAKRALELIQQGRPVLRGSIQTRFLYRPFDEAQKLGLPEETEALVRRMRPSDIGMLVVETVLPEGPGALAGLEEGDILVRINGEIVTHFVQLEEAFDSSIGRTVVLTVCRGGETIEAPVAVQDMHALTPSRLVTFGGCTANNLSYQLAYTYTLPLRGVFVAAVGSFLPNCDENEGIIIDRIDNVPIRNIDDLIEALRTLPNNEPVTVVVYSVSNIHRKRFDTIVASHAWSKIRVYTRNDATGLWDCEQVAACPRAVSVAPVDVRIPALTDPRAGPAAALSRSLVSVSCWMPKSYDGALASLTRDYGAIVDAARGLVVVSRRTVALAICNITVTIAGSLTLPGRLRFMHPTHNFAIVQYDPQRIGLSNIHEAELSPRALTQGDSARFVTFSGQGTPLFISTAVSDMADIQIDQSFPPCWRAINMESVQFESRLVSEFRFGLAADDDGRVTAFWIPFADAQGNTFSGGLPARAVRPALEALQRGEEPRLRLLNIEVASIALSVARAAGLSAARLSEVQRASTTRNTLFQIENAELLSRARGVLRPLDIIIAINGKLMLNIEDLAPQYTNEVLDLVVLRDKQEVAVRVETTEYNGGTSKLVVWCGATFQAPHAAAQLQTSKAPSGVYCTSVYFGSPADVYALQSTVWVTHVNGVETPDIDAFERVVRTCPDNTYARVKTVSFDLEPAVMSIKTCYHYWPTSSLVKDPLAESGWRSNEVPKQQQHP
ncbi:hypothetical protein H4R18_000117 [Coemansia javaensis]|uniref:Pro-apoptotic serine protease NMA111 n=1 Tax=Coemansia javaensis TaxID=2761396 RepID=A0A9W8HKK6_9FUNG|nr:hypothetical protein H4R18_000117 [Coemansia javaensis]